MFLLDAIRDWLGPTCLGVAERRKITITIAVLASTFMLGLGLSFSGLCGERWPLPAYVGLLALFHLLEYTWSWRFEGNEVGFHSFLLNKNWPQYHAAIAAAFLEYFVEVYLWPGKFSVDGKGMLNAASSMVAPIGFALCVCGLVVRVVGMWTCGNNFSHEIETQARADHVLVTSGIYQFLRHPAYTGWAYWSVGTQVLLCNPVGVLAYYWVVRQFFVSRIRFEEKTLLHFFGKAYVEYAKRTYLLIPGVPANVGVLGLVAAAEAGVNAGGPNDGSLPANPRRRPELVRDHSKAE